MDRIDLIGFVDDKVKSGKERKRYLLQVKSDDKYLMLSYLSEGYNPAGPNTNREFSLTVPRYMSYNQDTFEVLGLLQAEMGKTDNGCIAFANCEHKIINKVMKWFERELEVTFNHWRWYIKLNINEPIDESYKTEIEKKVVGHWLRKTKINSLNNHPKAVTYIKNTKNTRLRYHDYGTLIIECKSNLLSQIIKKYVYTMPHQIANLGRMEAASFMRGILAGESCVEIDKISKKYRVHVTANAKEERDIYQSCLQKLGVESKQYENYKDVIISKRKNNMELLKQKLMCLSPQKYAKFLSMMLLYPGISEETGYFKKDKKPHNKMAQEKVDRILSRCRQNPDWPCWKIAKKENASTISVARIKKKYNLGKRLIKTPKEIIGKVIELYNKNPAAYAYEIANDLGIHRARVERIRRKYNLDRQNSYRQ